MRRLSGRAVSLNRDACVIDRLQEAERQRQQVPTEERLVLALERIASLLHSLPREIKRPDHSDTGARLGLLTPEEHRKVQHARTTERWAKRAVIVASVSAVGTLALAIVAMVPHVS